MIPASSIGDTVVVVGNVCAFALACDWRATAQVCAERRNVLQPETIIFLALHVKREANRDKLHEKSYYKFYSVLAIRIVARSHKLKNAFIVWLWKIERSCVDASESFKKKHSCQKEHGSIIQQTLFRQKVFFRSQQPQYEEQKKTKRRFCQYED